MNTIHETKKTNYNSLSQQKTKQFYLEMIFQFSNIIFQMVNLQIFKFI
jgi:hypothetical protein